MVLSEKFVLEHRRTQKINFYDWIQVRLIQNAFTVIFIRLEGLFECSFLFSEGHRHILDNKLDV
jgi:hypothetical protein